ncbi:LysR family transcriptional regulator [Phaeobacter sp.]|uniref:LysR family transcriptional regulator n=1 Tax=Phaeobacter sp. TaxID=1902409 RepID=UPI0025DD6A3B|nr:LysR family transcriptional regulator [Phaeobacter sp.]
MNIEAIRTFLELSRLGNFSRVAEKMNITQSTASARIKVLEDHLSCRLFQRSPGAVTLTREGRQFYRYAASLLQMWQQGSQEIRQSVAYAGSVGVGVHMTMWRQFMPEWLVWMRRNHPDLTTHVEADYSERLTEYVREGFLDIAITHMPRALPGLEVEEFSCDRLVLVSSTPRDFADCKNSDYLHVDWSYGYREEHFEKLPELQAPPFNIGYGEIALAYLLVEDGFAYLPFSTVEDKLATNKLHMVQGAPELSRPAYLVKSRDPVHPERTNAAIEGLRAITRVAG